MTKKIAFAGPSITQKEIDYVTDAVVNGFYETFHKDKNKLEETMSEYLEIPYAIATQSCTVALHLACAALGLKEGDEVICTDLSWVATAYSIVYTGAKPVLVDIEPDTWCIDPQAIRKAITPKTKAIMLVHCFGIPAKMDEIMAIAKEHNLYVIEDAAPALGAKFQDRKVGSFGDVACFSFHGAKITASGEGGIFLTANKDIYEKAKHLSDMGRNDSVVTFYSDAVGYKYTIANLTAALALAQVERIDELVAKKRQYHSWYKEQLNDVPGIRFTKEREGDFANYCYPSIYLENVTREKRDRILDTLMKENIHARPAFPPMSTFPTLEKRFENPVVHEVSAKGICLPSAANLDRNDIERVCDVLKTAL